MLRPRHGHRVQHNSVHPQRAHPGDAAALPQHVRSRTASFLISALLTHIHAALRCVFTLAHSLSARAPSPAGFCFAFSEQGTISLFPLNRYPRSHAQLRRRVQRAVHEQHRCRKLLVRDRIKAHPPYPSQPTHPTHPGSHTQSYELARYFLFSRYTGVAGTYDTLCKNPDTGAYEPASTRASVAVADTNFTANKAKAGPGGAVAVSMGDSYDPSPRRVSAQFARVRASANAAQSHGGALYAGRGSEVDFGFSEISGNEAVSGNGGAVAIDGGVSARLAGVVADNNTCGGSGGGVWGAGAEAVSLVDSVVVRHPPTARHRWIPTAPTQRTPPSPHSNTLRSFYSLCSLQSGSSALGDGGGLCLSNGGSALLQTTTLAGNTAAGTGSRGGGAFVQNTTAVSVVSSSFQHNTVTVAAAVPRLGGDVVLSFDRGAGGGVVLLAADPLRPLSADIRDTNFTDNAAAAEGDGGGLCALGYVRVSVAGGAFARNSALTGGAAALAFGASAVFTGASLTSNEASLAGGGICAQSGANVTLLSSSLTSNAAYRGGAAALTGAATALALLSASSAADNQATLGAAFDLSEALYPSAQLRLSATTVTGNTAATAGGIFLLPRAPGVAPPACEGACVVSGNAALSYGPERALNRHPF